MTQQIPKRDIDAQTFLTAVYQDDVLQLRKYLHRVNLKQFGRLCAMVDWLYVYFDDDFDKLAKYVGDAELVTKFMQKTQTLIDSTITDRDVFVQRADKMWMAKEEWRDATARLAQEVLKE